MIKFYGIFQLVKVVKVGETKNKDLMIYFTAASNRTKDTSDFKLFKVFGKNAEKLINNLEKKGDGYKSRRMMIEGYVETYTEDRTVKCSASIKKEKFPAKYGELLKDFKVEASAVIKIQRDSYSVNHFQFLDKKTGSNTNFIDTEDGEEEIVFIDDDVEDDELMQSVALKSLTKSESTDIFNSVLDGETKLANFMKSVTG